MYTLLTYTKAVGKSWCVFARVWWFNKMKRLLIYNTNITSMIKAPGDEIFCLCFIKRQAFSFLKKAFYKKALFIHPFIPTKFQFEKCLGKMHYFKFKEYFVSLVIFHLGASSPRWEWSSGLQLITCQ